ncbi:MAG: protease inhibitor I42 family protein [Verrucomicrobia bacterium]|nr:protease inhibitor I42 family protein [Verrucomicrobiota bacterium]MBU1735919.1 protease inhibitor I42 family protein [Verrucomicrobiota bacterium]MBU1857155.1 protease inhibitor I42 family protein [Verrucomicrobiota bacterium]
MSEKTEEYLNPSEPIKVKAGQIFTIRMESNPTTGYSWQLSKTLDDQIILVTNAFIPPDSKLMGTGGHEVWTFEAIGEGQVEISMKYVRPWEKDQPIRTNVFTVIVK